MKIGCVGLSSWDGSAKLAHKLIQDYDGMSRGHTIFEILKFT